MKKKFLMVFILLITVGVVISGMLSLSLIKTNHEKDVKVNLIKNAKLIKHFVETNGPIGSMNEWLGDFDQDTDTRVTFIDAFGLVILDSQVEDLTGLENHGNRPEIKEAYKGHIGIDKRFSTSIERDLYYVAIPVDHPVVKVIRLSIPLDDLTTYIDNMVISIVVAALVGVVFATLLGIRFLNMFTKPLGDLTQATQNIAKGNFGEQVAVQSDDEIGQLATSFNTMSVELQDSIQELRTSDATNQAILTSMVNGLIAVDHDTRIMFINRTAQKMFNLKEEELIGQPLIEALKGHDLAGLFPKDFDLYSSMKKEIEFHDPHRYYKVFTSVVKEKEKEENHLGLLMSFIDVTQMRQLENMRKDFVANVSHELKTPLTSIQGFVETLKEGAAEDKALRDRFINIIEIEAIRLKSLIDDILVLSDIEKSTIDHNIGDVDLKQTVNEIVGMMEQIAHKKQVAFSYHVSDRLPVIKANPVWVKQMFINLVENGIKYTPKGGQVSLNIQDNDHGIKIIVEDNGIGIAEEHLDRLFERFYRVDKARSKKEGGTGLGLAIVKHIVLAMKGDIRVVSQVDQGTSFFIDIPLDSK